MFGLKRNKTKGIPVVNPQCIGCGICVNKCRRNVLCMSENTKEAFIRISYPENCTGCSRCVKCCPENAIRLIRIQTNSRK